MLFLQYKEVRLVKIPWLSGSDFNSKNFYYVSYTVMGNFWTVLFVHLAKYESISMVPKVYIHFCTTVCQFEKPEKRHFFIPYYFIMFCGPRYCFNWENARHFWAETKRILSIINRHLIATCHKKKNRQSSLLFNFLSSSIM